MVVQVPEKLKRELILWDKGTKLERENILRKLLVEVPNGDWSEERLEGRFGGGASLFLARIAAYLRLNYNAGCNVELVLSVVQAFVRASSAHRFLLEFLDVDGLRTLLEIVKEQRTTLEGRLSALRLLAHIASAGAQFRDKIFSQDGAKAICQCAATVPDDGVHEAVRNILLALGRGRTDQAQQLQEELIPLLYSEHGRVVRTSAQLVRLLLSPSSSDAMRGGSLVPRDELVAAVFHLLAASSVHIQYDGLEICRAVSKHVKMRVEIVEFALPLLVPQRPPTPEIATNPKAVEPEMTRDERLQLNVCRLLHMLICDEGFSEDICEMVCQGGGIRGLCVAMAGWREEITKYASLTLKAVLQHNRGAVDEMTNLLGPIFVGRFTSNAELGRDLLTYSYLNELLTNMKHTDLCYIHGEIVKGDEENGNNTDLEHLAEDEPTDEAVDLIESSFDNSHLHNESNNSLDNHHHHEPTTTTTGESQHHEGERQQEGSNPEEKHSSESSERKGIVSDERK